MYIHTRPKSLNVERYSMNDCTINAFGNALGISYDLSRKFLKIANPGVNDFTFREKERTIIAMSDKHHMERICALVSSEMIDYNGQYGLTASKFAEEYSDGIWLVIIRRHIFTVIDGRIVDTSDSGPSRVDKAYKVDLEKAHAHVGKLATHFDMDHEDHFFNHHIEKILLEHKIQLQRKAAQEAEAIYRINMIKEEAALEAERVAQLELARKRLNEAKAKIEVDAGKEELDNEGDVKVLEPYNF